MTLPSAQGAAAPFWSVMIPTYQPKEAVLRQTIESVLQQNIDSVPMQIQVVDDCSPEVAVEAMVKRIAGEKVVFSKTPVNLGLAGCWNTCIEQASGQWVHILHQDDYVLPGFYRKLEEAAGIHPQANLLATRSFLVDDDSIVFWVTERIRELEAGGHAVDRFFYHTPIQCPGVVVKRKFYEVNGGFLPSLVSGLDCEMWARVIGQGGGVVLPEVLACYRFYEGGETGKLARSAQILDDTVKTNKIFAERYPAFDAQRAQQRVLDTAFELATRFSRNGDVAAAKRNMDYWKANAPIKQKLRKSAIKLAKKIFG